MENNTLFILAVYLVACVIVAIEADTRGHGFGKGFFYSFFTSPLIGAILIAPYKPVTYDRHFEINSISELPETQEIIDLKKKYEAGELTFEQYNEAYQKLIKK